jgi:hypothetical protein
MCMMAVVCAIAGQAMGDVTWNAYNEFIAGPTAQSSSNMWQYFQNPGHDVNSDYVLFDKWSGVGPGGNGWTSTSPDDGWFFVQKDTGAGELRVSPWGSDVYTYKAVAIGWKSPNTGTVSANFSVTDRNSSGWDGVRYWLYKGGASGSEWLAKGTVGEGGTSGSITVPGISVSTGDMLYLRVDPNQTYVCDLTGVTFTVTGPAPEPGTIVILGTAVAGLLAYAWRKRR